MTDTRQMTNEGAGRGAGRRSILAILTAFLLIGLAYSIVNPLHEATDELRHYRFVQYLIRYRALPVQGEAGGLACTVQGHHPPLYYLTAALLTFGIDTGREVCHEPPTNPFWAYRYWEVGRDNKNQYLHGPDEAFPWRGEALAAHLARIVNLLFGAAAVWLTWATARVLWPDRPALAAGSAAFIAFNPMFLFMAGAINNDVVAAAAGAGVTYACVRLLHDERGLSPGWGIRLGLLYGIALMSKFNLAAIVLVIEAAVTWVAWRRGQWRQWIVANLSIAGMAALLAGWWFIRNQILYGEPTGFERLTELWGVRDPRQSFRLAVSELPYAWTSLWARFGYGQIPLPQAFYTGMALVAVLATGGYARNALRRGAPAPHGRFFVSPPTAALLLLALNVFVFFGVLFNYLLVSPAGPMGRFFFPALPSLAILMGYGLSLWSGTAGGRGTADDEPKSLRRLAVVTNLGMAAFALVALFGYLAPAYARPPSFAAGADLPNPVDIQFDTLVKLRGYALDTRSVRPGEPIGIELYWEVTGQPPGNYLLFVHLTDETTGAIVAQRDTHPGLGNFPSSEWRPGDRFVERLSLYLPETAYAPSGAVLSAGLYAPEGYRLGLVNAATGEGLGDAFSLGRVDIEPNAPNGAAAAPNPGSYDFEGFVRLLGYEYDRRILGPGEPLALTLYWQRLSSGVYDVSLRVLGEGDAVIAEQRVALPGRTGPNETAVERYVLPLDPSAAGQRLTVELALTDAEGRRLNLVGDDGRWLDDKLRLSAVHITN